MLEQFDRGNSDRFTAEMEKASEARAPVYQMLTAFEAEMKQMDRSRRNEYKPAFRGN